VIPCTFLLVAGESSGDMYGADVALALARRFPGCKIYGLGGERMLEAGVELLGDIRHTAVIGPFEFISHLGALFKVFRRLSERAETSPPDAAILIDFPDFNLRMARRLKGLNIPIIYYISPQVWAWRESRVEVIRELVDRMLVIFPFEEDFYRKAGVKAEFVGHPLIEKVRATKTKEEFCRAHGINPRLPIVALLPGSRRKEIRYILPTLCEAAMRILAAKPDTQFVLPAAPNLDPGLVEQIVATRPITVVWNDTYNAVRYARAAIVASGTATLETALLGTPQVIVYRISPASAWLLGRFFLKVRMYGIVNIILGEEVAPELFQRRFTPELVTEATLRLMDDVWVQSRIRGNYETLRRQLSGGDVAERVADVVEETVRPGRLQTKG
jgi:lipid-A-disaccharide synthase